ncbi:hypothetical protein HK414_13015 [Ramlibacter terrae]|uniref:Uncharacterized protein n=1 Tax=Ramlibacter terrae TaxID=2732511 RepID=A0ABX6P5G2_9BURK|nr:hypothetical protein HK414_13015 [Ramlibacter terrae]
MTPEAFAALGAGGIGAAGAAAGMGAGTAAASTASGAGNGLLSQFGNYLTTADGMKTALGVASALGGAAGGAKGESAEKTTSTELPSHLQGPVSNLFGQATGLLNAQLPETIAQGQSTVKQGQGLLGMPIAGNGTGLLNMPKNNVKDLAKVKLGTVNFNNNPYMKDAEAALGMRTRELLSDNNLQIQGNAVSSGGLGGSRQGLAQGIAAGKAADYLQSNLAGMYSNARENQSNRNLTQYGMDQNYNLAGRGQNIQLRGQDLSKYQGDQQFYGQQRQQDQSGAALGAGLVAQGQQAPWNTLGNANDIFKSYFGNGNQTTSAQSGGGWSGALGGLMQGIGYGSKMGWWGS